MPNLLESAIVDRINRQNEKGVISVDIEKVRPLLPQSLVDAKEYTSEALREFSRVSLIKISSDNYQQIENQAIVIVATELAIVQVQGSESPSESQLDSLLIEEIGGLKSYWFDTECIYEEGSYVKIVQGFSGISDGHFLPENIKDIIPEDDNLPCMIEFDWHGKHFRFEVEHHTDWADVDGLLQGINKCFIDNPTEKHYCSSETGDQTARIWFLTGEQASALGQRDWVSTDGETIFGVTPEWWFTKAKKAFQAALDARDMIESIEAPPPENFKLKKQEFEKQAYECIDNAISMVPDSPLLWAYKGTMFYHMDKLKEAIPCFDQSLQLDPTKSLCWIKRGEALRALGDHQRAYESFQRAYSIEVTPETLYNLGFQLIIMKHINEGLSYINHGRDGIKELLEERSYMNLAETMVYLAILLSRREIIDLTTVNDELGNEIAKEVIATLSLPGTQRAAACPSLMTVYNTSRDLFERATSWYLLTILARI